MNLFEIDEFTMDPESVDLVGKVEYYSSSQSYGFIIIVGGSSVIVGKQKKKNDSEKIKQAFITEWKNCIARSEEVL